MKSLHLSVTWLAASLLMSASAFAQSTPAQKQPTESWGGLSCNLVADAKADPECAAYLKQKTQNLTPSPLEADVEATGQKK
jgi:hypothetical protein